MCETRVGVPGLGLRVLSVSLSWMFSLTMSDVRLEVRHRIQVKGAISFLQWNSIAELDRPEH